MEIDTTAPSYWLNWRFLLCAIWILVAMASSSALIWRNERPSKLQKRRHGNKNETKSHVFKIDAWRTCSKSIHPIALLVFRVFAFCCMLPLIISDAVVNTGGVFQFYTEWTFTLVTIYFALGSLVSIRGCLHYSHEADSADEERGEYTAPKLGDNSNESNETININVSVREYALQIMFQMCAGAVVLTDIVFWLVLYPFLMPKTFKLNFIAVCMHSVNAVFLLGETILNNLKFPFFRIAYFILWTCVYVVFQWIIHACVSTSWPYSFLDLSSEFAPAWYVAVGLLHFPCLGIFAFIVKMKQQFLSR